MMETVSHEKVLALVFNLVHKRSLLIVKYDRCSDHLGNGLHFSAKFRFGFKLVRSKRWMGLHKIPTPSQCFLDMRYANLPARIASWLF